MPDDCMSLHIQSIAVRPERSKTPSFPQELSIPGEHSSVSDMHEGGHSISNSLPTSHLNLFPNIQIFRSLYWPRIIQTDLAACINSDTIPFQNVNHCQKENLHI